MIAVCIAVSAILACTSISMPFWPSNRRDSLPWCDR